ncbi:RdgB/HAM1 family non-canonical purine NTP pyrophosphatase [Actinomycetospora sp. NBRC 106375]|uniref:RdgB/HAM1 family non-canonical purine NTP pyrophosphatase n=1 Tax=Actinomycetospora sp. NBRC 106375 TaxID=3032207 RepID=UPI00255356B6|nr:RdgB/HAM1 family non-canonical purine NTP pyrophosphatase [Actinomycetospora sp. NBRC 106375]
MGRAPLRSVSRLLLATRNDAKLAELRRLTEGLEVVGLDDVPEFPEAPETGATFEENALAKARDAAAATGLVAVADDSGLAVDALNGMPGVLSARWSGRGPIGSGAGSRVERDHANLALVLDQMADVPEDRRGAAFVCAAAAAHPDGREIVVVERWPGSLIRLPRGTNGFGYDPAFVPEGESRTSAEMDPSEKDAVSHRSKALRALIPRLSEVS